MIDDAHRTEDVVTEHLPQFFIGIGAMGTGGDEHDHIVEADGPLELLEDGGDNGAPGLGARPVTDGDGDRLPGAHELAQRWPAHRPAQGGNHLGPAVRCRRRVGGDDHVRAVLGQVDAQACRTVGKLDFHAPRRYTRAVTEARR